MSDGFTKLLFSTLALVAYGLCFFFLAKSLEGLDISLAYAVWAGVGIVIVNLFGAGH